MKNITETQMIAAHVAARVWNLLGDERQFILTHGHPWNDRKSFKDWEWQLDYCHRMNLIAMGGEV